MFFVSFNLQCYFACLNLTTFRLYLWQYRNEWQWWIGATECVVNSESIGWNVKPKHMILAVPENLFPSNFVITSEKSEENSF